MFVRMSYDIPPLFGTAYAQWLGADAEDRHPGGDPHDAPLGSALCYKGSSAAGHIMLAARKFTSGTGAAWSNDMVQYGEIDKVSRTSPVTSWNQRYLGYLTAVNDYDLRLKTSQPPVPKQTKRYLGIKTAIHHLESALDTAKTQHDKSDVEELQKEIARLKKMYDHMRRR